MARSMAFFSLVGLLIGAAAAGIHVLVSLVLAVPAADFLALAFLVFITGNMHADGLMDAADGLFSGRPRERMLEIMRDSRVGSHGVMAGILDILAKFILLGQIPAGRQGVVLILAVALGRWAQVYGAAQYPYARSTGGAGSFTVHVGYRELLINSLTVLVPAWFLFKLAGLAICGTVFVGTAMLDWYIAKKIGGMTGDTLGAASECAEVLTMLAALLVMTKI